MSHYVLKQLPLLQLLIEVNSKTRKNILKSADFNLITAIVECIHNTLEGNLNITKEKLLKLKKHKKVLRKIKSCDNEWLNKKKIIVQSGGSFLPILLPPVISFVLDRLLK